MDILRSVRNKLDLELRRLLIHPKKIAATASSTLNSNRWGVPHGARGSSTLSQNLSLVGGNRDRPPASISVWNRPAALDTITESKSTKKL